MKKINLFLLMLLAGAHLIIRAAEDAELARILEMSAQEEAERQRKEAQFEADLQAILVMEANANSASLRNEDAELTAAIAESMKQQGSLAEQVARRASNRAQILGRHGAFLQPGEKPDIAPKPKLKSKPKVVPKPAPRPRATIATPTVNDGSDASGINELAGKLEKWFVE